MDAEVILHLLRHEDRERATGVPAGATKVVNQIPLRWLWDGLRARGQHTEHPFWYARATSHHSDTLIHKADWAASRDTVLQNTPPDPSHAQLIVTGHDVHLHLRPPTMRTLGAVAQRAQTDHAPTHRGHTPLGGPTPQLMSTPGTSARRPPTTGLCRPGTTTRRCNAGSASERRNSPALPSSSSRAPFAATRRRPRCTCTWDAPTCGSSGPTTVKQCKRRLSTSRPGTRLYGWPRGAPRAPHGQKSSALGWWQRRRKQSSAQQPAKTRRENLRRQFPPRHAPAGGFRVGASQPPAGATTPRAPKHGGPGAPMAHRGRGQLPTPLPCALARTL